jgi:hypothetical protein
VTLVLAFSTVWNPSHLHAQMVGTSNASRAELTALLDSLQNVAINSGDEDDRRDLQNQISGLAYRLQQGDIWPGDVVDLSVGGEAKWVGQFTVTTGRQIELEDIAPLSMEGVLYSEAEESISLQLARYLREPRVRVTVLKRIGIIGAVGNPGFFDVSGSSLVSDVIMTAGGPAANANVDKIELRRMGHRLETGRPNVVWQSLSLDQLGVTSGDEVFVPIRKTPPIQWLMASLGVVLTLLWLWTRVF